MASNELLSATEKLGSLTAEMDNLRSAMVKLKKEADEAEKSLQTQCQTQAQNVKEAEDTITKLQRETVDLRHDLDLM